MRRLLAAVAAAAVVLGMHWSRASAVETGDTAASGDSGAVGVVVAVGGDGGVGPSGGGAGGGGSTGGGYSGFDGRLDCSWWVGRDSVSGVAYPDYQEPAPTVGAIYVFRCTDLLTGAVVVNEWRIYDPAPGNPGGAPVPDAAQLATQALDLRALPPPALQVSPIDPAGQVVNVATYLWAQPPAPVSARADVGAFFAEATATPGVLEIDPGDGSAPIVCSDWGRPWQPGDPRVRLASDACGFTYRSAGAHTLTATVRWSVRFTTNLPGGGGVLADRVSTSTLQLSVRSVHAELVDPL